MEQYINDFITYLREMKRASSNTLKAYLNDLKKLQHYLDKQQIDSVNKLSETVLNSYVLSLEKDGLSPASVSRSIASMKAFLLYLLKQGKISGDPSERIKPPKVLKKAPQAVDTNIIDQLLQLPDSRTPKGIRDRAMLELLYATGMKVSELVTARISDLNLSARYITCGEKKERNIPFGKTAKAALQSYLTIRKEQFDAGESDLLFLNSSGEQLSRQGLWKILKSYAKSVGLQNINPNAIRHSFAIHLIDNGADLESVREFLGHADITTTQLYLAQNHKNSREVYMNSHPRA